MNGTTVLGMLEGKEFILGKGKKDSMKGKKKKNLVEKIIEDGTHQKRKRKKDRSDCKVDKKPEDWLKKWSAFFQLPYWEHNKLRHNIDVMHLEKMCLTTLSQFYWIFVTKQKDHLQAQQDSVEFGTQENLHPMIDNEGKKTIPDAPFSMSREQKEIMCSVIHSLRTPDGYASNISRCVNMKGYTLSGLKSHDDHVSLHDNFPVAL